MANKAIFVASFCFGLSYAGFQIGQLPALDWEHRNSGGRHTLQGLVISPPELRHFSNGLSRQRVYLRAEDDPACIYMLAYYGEHELRAGQHLSMQARLKPPWGLSNPGSYNYRNWLVRNGVCATGYIVEESLRVDLSNDGRLPWYQHQRQLLLDRWRAQDLPPLATGIAAALSLGIRGEFPDDSWTFIGRSGLAHLFVISGLHVGMVAAFGMLLGQCLLRLPGVQQHWRSPSLIPSLMGLMLAAMFSLMAGMGVPTQRALLMLVFLVVAHLFARRIVPSRSLLIVFTLLNLHDPLATHNPGFWLSFGAVALIFFLLHRGQHSSSGRLRQLLGMQMGLSLGVGLLASLWFGGLNLLSPLLNVLAVPFVSLLLVPAVLISSLQLLLGFELPSLFAGLFVFTGELLNQLQQLSLSLAPWYWLEIRPWAYEFFLLVLAGVLWALFFRQRWGLLVVFLTLPLLSHAFTQSVDEGELELTVFDVGQGLSVLVQSPELTLLYDTGGGDPQGFNMATAVVQPYLQQRGIRHLDLLVISHGDLDHASGVGSLSESLEIGEVWFGESAFPIQLPQSPCLRGFTKTYGKLVVRQLHPTADSDPPQDNDRSCVLMLEWMGFRILLSGDITRRTELELVQSFGYDLTADLLLVPHHGSATSSSGPFLRHVAPVFALNSAGFLNRFGHPTPDIVGRYARIGSQFVTTADSGAIQIRVVGGELTQFKLHRRYLSPWWL